MNYTFYQFRFRKNGKEDSTNLYKFSSLEKAVEHLCNVKDIQRRDILEACGLNIHKKQLTDWLPLEKLTI